jgi:hypothetical protein
LSFKRGEVPDFLDLNAPETLLTEFGAEGWYGPIKDKDLETNKVWYIRTVKVPHYTYIGNDAARSIDRRSIRWTVVAEIGNISSPKDQYLSLSWNGFSSNELDNIDSTKQFTYWSYIPDFFREIEGELGAKVQNILLHKIVLHDLWNKYLNNSTYRWQHLRIRAESSGVALNAHSAGVADIDVKGLKALTHKLAESALESLKIPKNDSEISLVEIALLQTLIKEWGTKSYEFSLAKICTQTSGLSVNVDKVGGEKEKKIFRAHCYFGFKLDSDVPDSLQHLHCFLDYGGSNKVLQFLLTELQQCPTSSVKVD